MTARDEAREMYCGRCNLPREFYNLKPEPSFASHDFRMPTNCQEGHLWIYAVSKKEVL